MRYVKFAVLVLALSLVAPCGTVPVPKKETTKTVSNTVVEQKEKPLTTTHEQKPVPVIKHPVPTTNHPIPIANPAIQKVEQGHQPEKDTLTTQEHIQNGIKYLQVGEEQNAKQELKLALLQEPANSTAVGLLNQINTPATKYFEGESSFPYTTGSGDSLSTIAKKFLNDPLKFYILAKFNDIDNPSRLQAGQTIKIPGRNPVSFQKQPIKPEKIEPSEEEITYALAKKYYDAGKYQETIDLLERFVQQNSKDLKSRDLLVLSYTQYANSLAEKANLLEAQTVLEKALSMQPKNLKLKQQLENIENRREADRLYQRGVEALQAGNEDKAYEDFKKVLVLSPKHTLAKKQIIKLKADVIETYHKQAMQLYRRQQLDEAIVVWNKVLELDPDHELAKLYRARAIELKEKLKKLESEK